MQAARKREKRKIVGRPAALVGWWAMERTVRPLNVNCSSSLKPLVVASALRKIAKSAIIDHKLVPWWIRASNVCVF